VISGVTISVRSNRWVALQRSIAVEVLSSSIIFPSGAEKRGSILFLDDPADVIVLARHINENEA
jgi:hypothetical protein